MNSEFRIQNSEINARNLFWILTSGFCLLLFGCTGSPNKANIELRKENQSLQSQLTDLQRQRAADTATIHSLQQQKGTLPTLAQSELDELFTTHGLELGRLSDVANLDPNKPGVQGVKVYAVPTDEMGQPLKAAGSFVVELFDLAKQNDNLVGRWDFSIAQARQSWYGHLMLYTYVLSCPWKNPPTHSQLTLRVTFHDELTQREFVEQKVIYIRVR
jgi:hypothetical protein